MLTDKKLKSLKPRDKEYTVSDNDSSRGQGRLVIRVRPSGAKDWLYFYYVDGKRRKKALGKYPVVSLSLARQKAAERAEEVADTGYIAEVTEPAEIGSVGELLTAYVEDLRDRGKRSADDVERFFRCYIERPAPALWAKPANEATPHDFRDVLARHIKRGVTTAVNRVRANLHAAYQFALQAEFNPRSPGGRHWGLTSNPISLIPLQADYERQGERVLEPGEVKAFWQGIGKTVSVGPQCAALARLCVATAGQRPTSLLRLRVEDLDFDKGLVSVPPESTKTGKPHVFPMNRHSRRLLSGLAAQAKDNGEARLFASSHKKDSALNVRTLSTAIGTYREQHKAKHWTLRDVRRTAKTILGQRGIPKEDRDRLHGHAKHDVSSKHYDRYDYLPEKRKAMAAWETWLDDVLETTK